jgi:phenylalanyl-tRNA synthetase beta chain
LEEIARLYGYERLPVTRMAAELPPSEGDTNLPRMENMRDLLVELGLTEVISMRMTTPEREKRLWLPGSPEDHAVYLPLANPISPERSHLRRSLLASVLEIAERNSRLRDHLALFELGPVFHPIKGELLPDEHWNVALMMTGRRYSPAWDRSDMTDLDYFDLKGAIEGLMDGLHIRGVSYRPIESYTFHPGKCVGIFLGDEQLGVAGELHPLVKERYDFSGAAILAAELSLDKILKASQVYYEVEHVAAFPPVLEDIAVVVDESLQADRVEQVIRKAGGKLLAGVRLFDIYRGPQIGDGLKSMAYSLTYQAGDRTLTDTDATQIRQRIVRALERELGAKLRS